MSLHLTTEQMQAALAKVNPSQAAASESSPISVADLIADTGAGVVAFVEEAGSNTVDFAERVKVRYQFQRAVRKGLIALEAPKAAPARRTSKAS